jgi:hypothetical protein
LAVERFPHLAHPVHLEVVVPQPEDLGRQLLIAPLAGRGRPVLGRVVRRGRQLERLADRLDAELVAVGVDEGDYLGGRGSSSRAKKAALGLEDLIGPAQLTDLPFQLGDPLRVLG